VLQTTGAEENLIFPSPENFLNDLDLIVWHQEEPFGGTGMAAQWEVLKAAKKKVKILLDGQGGDENLCGYRKFYYFYLKKLLDDKKYPRFTKESFAFFSSPDILKTRISKTA